MANVHDGHRARMKQKFLTNGLESFTDIEAIELLLFFAIPRRDTNELAHVLLQRFHSFRGVLEAPAALLQETPGIGESAAVLISLVTALNRRYLSTARKLGEPLLDSTAAGAYLKPLYAYCREERVILLCLDSASRLLCCRTLNEGTARSVDFTVRDVVDVALRENAVRVILSHNHVSGTALPSGADNGVTAQLYQALRLVGVELADHIIVCDDDFVSMRDSGFFSRF